MLVIVGAPSTSVAATLLLLAGAGSLVDEPTFAVFERVPVADGVTATASMNVAAPTFIDAVEQEMEPPAPTAGVVHDQPAGVESETNVVDAGSVSVITTDAAGSGPLLATVIVYVRFWPATTGFGAATFVIASSARLSASVAMYATTGSRSVNRNAVAASPTCVSG